MFQTSEPQQRPASHATDVAAKAALEQSADVAAALTEPDMPEMGEGEGMQEAHDKEIQAQWHLLKEIEDQCLSHGRHPAEWDNVKLSWVDPVSFRYQGNVFVSLVQAR
jgi:hypothetical protein